MDQNLDAAVATLTGYRNIVNQQKGLGSVTGVTTPLLGMRVVKSGRTTGVTKGIIDGIGGRRMFNYGGISRMVREHIHIIPAPDGTPTVSSPGDSGAWWLEESTQRAVGLHFGGNDHPEYALAFSMPPVLEALNVDLIH
jgi:endonuclease G